MDPELTSDERESFHRGFLLTTQERKLAKAKAEAHKLRAQIEVVQAKAELAQQEAAELREHLIAIAAKARFPGVRTILAWSGVALLSIAVLRISYLGYTRPSATLSEAVSLPTSSTPSSKRSVITHKAPPASDKAFKMAMSRLQDELDALPENESEIVREVNSKNPGGPRPCPLEWVNGEAALSLDGNAQHISPSLLSAVTQCADAVEKLHEAKEMAPVSAIPPRH